MDHPRDLGQVELWQQSLERSLARRGRPKRSSVELYRLRGERDLTLDDELLESSQHSQLRRRAAAHPLAPRPVAAVGGVSALTLLAAATLPWLLNGRSSGKGRITYASSRGAGGRAGSPANGPTSRSLQPRALGVHTLVGRSTAEAAHTTAVRWGAAPKAVSVSESTRQLQRRLGVSVDGDFGPITLRAVKAFQASHGLVVDGIVGPATRAALGLPAGPVLRANPAFFPQPVKPVHHVVRAAPKPVHHVAKPRPKPVHHVAKPQPKPVHHVAKPRPKPKPTPAPEFISAGASIRLMQQRLGIPADGQFGPVTTRALKAFQSRHGLVADGILSPATRAALRLPHGRVLRPNRIYFHKRVKPARHVLRAAAKPAHHVSRSQPHRAPRTLSIAATIRLMQERLGIPADGQFGPVTKRALKAFQSRHGLVADGILSPATRAALGLPAGPVLRPNRAYFPRPAVRRSTPTRHHSRAHKPRHHPRAHKPAVHHSPPPRSSTGYVNPLAHASVTPERIDQGVDYAGTGTLTSIGKARITYVATSGTGWPGAFIEYQLLDGPDAGRYVFYAEGVRPAGGISVGRVVQPGQAVAYLIPGWSTGIEIGWGAGIGTEALAAKLGEHSFPTAAGENFSALIASLGGPPGRG